MMIQYGATPHFVVSYDSSFTGAAGVPNGPLLAQSVLDTCEYDLTRLSQLFGNILPLPASFPIQINLVPGGGGANNNLLNLINCNCNLGTQPQALPALVVAEEGEIFMALQAKGWIANWSHGEALSRVLAQILYPDRSWLWSTGNAWLNGLAGSPNAARSNFVDNVYHSDTDNVATGCGSLFLNYLAYQLGYRWPDIIGAGAPNTNTLAETATALGVTNGWVNFLALITTYLPPGTSLPPEPTSIGQPPEATDDPYPLGPLPPSLPQLYLRHNLADDGTTHTGSLSDSPDIILKNTPVANPQITFSTAASINSDTESDTAVLSGQANTVYLRAWNRGADAPNTFATVYWSPPATLVTPNLWTLIGSAYFPDAPPGSAVQVSTPGIVWPADQLPGPGHYCFVATVGNADQPAANPASFATFDDFMNYVYANNNFTWRNFNVVPPPPAPGPAPHFMHLPFLITGAWDREERFSLETHTQLPDGSRLNLHVPSWLARTLRGAPSEKSETAAGHEEEAEPGQTGLPLHAQHIHYLGEVVLPKGKR